LSSFAIDEANRGGETGTGQESTAGLRRAVGHCSAVSGSPGSSTEKRARMLVSRAIIVPILGSTGILVPHGFRDIEIREPPFSGQLVAQQPIVSHADTKTFSASCFREHLRGASWLVTVALGRLRQRPTPRSPAQQHAPLPNLLLNGIPGQLLVSAEIIIQWPWMSGFVPHSNLRAGA